MKRIGTGWVVVSMLGVFAGAGAFGQTPGDAARGGNQPGARDRARGGGRGAFVQSWMQEAAVARIVADPKQAADLGLSEAQIKTIKESVEQLKSRREELQKQLMELETQQGNLMDQGTVDENALLALMDKASQIRLEMDKAGVKHALLIKRTLTPEQNSKIKELVEQHRKTRDADRGEGRKGADHAGQPPAPPVPAAPAAHAN